MRFTSLSLALALLVLIGAGALTASGWRFTIAPLATGLSTPSLFDLLLRASVLLLAGSALAAGAYCLSD